MNNTKYILPIFFFLLISPIIAQQKEQIIIPLSKPNKPGTIYIRHNSGSIKIVGYNGSNVIIDASFENQQDNSGRSGELKKINRKTVKLNATEKNNNVSLSTNNYDENINLDIKVPYNFSAYINLMEGEGIELHNISGNFVLNCNDGNILLLNVSGSAVASTLDGDIIAQFDKVNTEMPMKFTILSGKIDLTFPAQMKATFDMRSEFGDILTDINLDLDKREVKESSKNGLKRYSLESAMVGKMNGGGQRITLRALDGNIYIRKNK